MQCSALSELSQDSIFWCEKKLQKKRNSKIKLFFGELGAPVPQHNADVTKNNILRIK